MKKILTFIIVLLSIAYSCSDAEAKESKSKSNAFENIDKKDRKLFTQQEKINSYNKSLKKSESIKASLSANSGYSGYGSAKSVEKKESSKKIKKNKVAKPKFSNAGFSAYSTN
tara:strand:+ start:1637 stop:1975 length:339 start_codon:yes stop_codon:yes gene_type:complete